MSGETPITIRGNLTADVELRYTQGGRAVANFTIASTPRVFNRETKEWGDGETLFLRTTLWGSEAERLSKSAVKGTRVMAVGDLKQNSFETKEGEKRTSIELIAEEVAVSLKYAIVSVERATAADSDDAQATESGGDETPF